MIYGQDAPIAFPVADLYDSGMMQMYVQAVRDQYQQGLRDYENFISKYGDFSSPIAADVQAWDEKIMNPTIGLIESLYQQGIDPTRNAEARAMIMRSMRNIPYGWANQARQRKAAADEYVKNRAALQKAGKWSPELESYILGGKSLETWNPEIDGEWTRTSPTEAQTLQEFVHPSFAALKPHLLNKDEVEKRGYVYDPSYDYTGITKSDMERSMRKALPGLVGNELYGFYKEQAKKDLITESGDPNYTPTEEEIVNRFVENAITADAQVMSPLNRAENEFVKMKKQYDYNVQLDNIRTNNDIAADRAKRANAYYYDMLAAGADIDGDGKVSKQEAAAFAKANRGGGNKDKEKSYNIFREADSKPNGHVNYMPEDSYDINIDPLNDGIYFVGGTADEEGNTVDKDKYIIPKGTIKNTIFSHESVYAKNGTRKDSKNNHYHYTMDPMKLDDGFEYEFEPSGPMRSITTHGGNKRYFISGELYKKSDDGTRVLVKRNNSKYNILEMEVQERYHPYGRK